MTGRSSRPGPITQRKLPSSIPEAAPMRMSPRQMLKEKYTAAAMAARRKRLSERVVWRGRRGRRSS